jgi:xanthine dehydrogenase/oxidase
LIPLAFWPHTRYPSCACVSVAQAATKLVQVTYEDSGPGIFTVEEAIHHKSFYPYTNKIVDGDVDAALGADGVQVCRGVWMFSCPCVEVLGSHQVLEGVVRNGGQEHFYLEPNACLCIPGEGLESVTVYSSTQVSWVVQANPNGLNSTLG